MNIFLLEKDQDGSLKIRNITLILSPLEDLQKCAPVKSYCKKTDFLGF
jgi:hypothetical protein